MTKDDLPLSSVDRRTVLKGTIAASAVGFGTTTFGRQAFAQEEQSFVVEQEDECFDLTPLETGETVEDFYGYATDGEPHSHTSTGIEQSNVSNLFLFTPDSSSTQGGR